MNIELLQRVGLTESQAKSYLTLVKAGSLTPPKLAALIKESRTTAYMALARLEELGLAKQVENTAKKTYAAVNPAVLEKYIAKQQQDITKVQDDFHNALPNLLSYYFTHRSEPGVRFYQGEHGLEKIYEDHLRTGEFVHVIRTPADDEHFGPILYRYMNKRAELGIRSEFLGPNLEGSVKWAAENDQRLKRVTAWFPANAYKSPVEICIYGNKVSFISFGDEAVGMIVESPQIAAALRDIYAMAKLGAAELMKHHAKTTPGL